MNILAKIMPLTTPVPLQCSVIYIQTNITISPFNAKIFKKSTNLHGLMVHLRGFGTMVCHSIYFCDSLEIDEKS